MKRIVYILLILSMIFALVSCDSDPRYSALTALANKQYGMVKISVSTSNDGINLNSSYKITGSLVTYNVEVLEKITIDGDEEQKVTKSGEAFISDGNIISVDGTPVANPASTSLTGKFKFEESNLKNAVITESTFSADIVKLSSFLGTDTKGTVGRVELEYNTEKIVKINLSYIENGANVKVLYEFL